MKRLLLCITAAFILAGCGRKAPVANIRPVRTLIAHSALDSLGKSFPTKAKAASDANLSFDYPGTISRIYVKEGDSVRRGQVVAEIDGRDFTQALNAARADYQIASSTYERVKNAAAANAVSKQDLDAARTKFEQAQSQLAVRQKAFSNTRLLAPFDGEVTGKYANEFTNIGAGMPVLRIINSNSIDLPVSLPEAIMARWSNDIDKVEIFATFDVFPGREFPVTIKNRSNEADPYTGAYNVTVTMSQPADVKIIPGNVGQVIVRLKKDATALPEAGYIIIPPAAIRSIDNETDVFVVDEKTMTVSLVPVTVKGATPSGLSVEGLKDGQRIVSAGVQYLVAGQKIKLLTATEDTDDSAADQNQTITSEAAAD